MLSFKGIGGGRLVLIVVVLALCGAMLVGWGVMGWRSMSRSPDRLDLMASVKPDTEFWLHKRVPGTHRWEIYPFPRDQAVAVLRAMTTSQPWEPVSRFSFSSRYVYPGGMKLMLVWCMNMKDSAELRRNVLWIHFGNKLISYGDKIYVVPAEGREILDRMFPREGE